RIVGPNPNQFKESVVGAALALVGFIVYLVGWVMVVWLAFRDSVWWGLGCFFVPFVALYFVITHWDEAKKGFFTTLAGAVLIFAGAMATPMRPRPPGVVQAQQAHAAVIPATTTHPTCRALRQPAPE